MEVEKHENGASLVSERTSAGLAWSLCGLALTVVVCFFVLAIPNHAGLEDLSFPIVGVSGALVGGVVASRRPTNPIGWLFLVSALVASLRALTEQYAIYGIITDPGSLPMAQAMAWFSTSVQVEGPVLGFILVPFYFPNGRPVSPRFNFIPWAAFGLLPIGTVLEAFLPGEAVYDSGIQNPLGVEALRPYADVFNSTLFVLYIGLIFASAASLVVRFRRASGEERQQIKWLTYAAAIIPVWFVLNSPVEAAFPKLFAVMDALIIAAVPIAAGVAILRYRLYDIDRIINRTLVYTALTASLTLVYFGGIAFSQYVLHVLTGGKSRLAVVASTLVIAALFNPLRHSIQGFIDQRFYRRKYDAVKTMEAFNARLRDEVSLENLTGDLVTVVEQTVQPAHVSLWLRPSHAGQQKARRGR